MPSIKIGRRTIAGILPEAKPVIFYDTDLKGFGLLVRPSGEKRWIVEYRPGAGGRGVAKKRVVLGPCDASMLPEAAREAATTMLAKVRTGADPAAERATERSSDTVKELAAAFLTRHVEAKRKASTADYYRQVIETHIVPALGSKRAVLVTRADVARLHSAIAGKKRVKGTSTKARASKAQTQGGKTAANRALAILSAIYGWADGAGLVPEGTNPTRKIEKFEEQSRERFLTAEELERLGATLRLAETEGLPRPVDDAKPRSKHAPRAPLKLSPSITGAVRLLMLTGARLREILNLEWAHVDIERGALFLPDSKTGKKTVILSTPALAVLAGLPRVGRYVIASDSAGTDDEKPRQDIKKPWAQITRHAGLEGLRIHDLRHTFASIGAGSGLGLPVIGGLLGHADSKTTQRYAHLAVEPVRVAADLIAHQIAASMGEQHDKT